MAPHKMGQLEIKSVVDEAWYEAKVSILRNQKLKVSFLGFAGDDETLTDVAEVKERVRYQSNQLQDEECSLASEGDVVCALCTDNEFTKYFNGRIEKIQKKPHKVKQVGGEECTCAFSVTWHDGPKVGVTETVACGDICTLSEEDVTSHPLIKQYLDSFSDKSTVAAASPPVTSPVVASPPVTSAVGSGPARKKGQKRKGTGDVSDVPAVEKVDAVVVPSSAGKKTRGSLVATTPGLVAKANDKEKENKKGKENGVEVDPKVALAASPATAAAAVSAVKLPAKGNAGKSKPLSSIGKESPADATVPPAASKDAPAKTVAGSAKKKGSAAKRGAAATTTPLPEPSGRSKRVKMASLETLGNGAVQPDGAAEVEEKGGQTTVEKKGEEAQTKAGEDGGGEGEVKGAVGKKGGKGGKGKRVEKSGKDEKAGEKVDESPAVAVDATAGSADTLAVTAVPTVVGSTVDSTGKGKGRGRGRGGKGSEAAVASSPATVTAAATAAPAAAATAAAATAVPLAGVIAPAAATTAKKRAAAVTAATVPEPPPPAAAAALVAGAEAAGGKKAQANGAAGRGAKSMSASKGQAVEKPISAEALTAVRSTRSRGPAPAPASGGIANSGGKGPVPATPGVPGCFSPAARAALAAGPPGVFVTTQKKRAGAGGADDEDEEVSIGGSEGDAAPQPPPVQQQQQQQQQLQLQLQQPLQDGKAELEKDTAASTPPNAAVALEALAAPASSSADDEGAALVSVFQHERSRLVVLENLDAGVRPAQIRATFEAFPIGGVESIWVMPGLLYSSPEGDSPCGVVLFTDAQRASDAVRLLSDEQKLVVGGSGRPWWPVLMSQVAARDGVVSSLPQSATPPQKAGNPVVVESTVKLLTASDPQMAPSREWLLLAKKQHEARLLLAAQQAAEVAQLRQKWERFTSGEAAETALLARAATAGEDEEDTAASSATAALAAVAGAAAGAAATLTKCVTAVAGAAVAATPPPPTAAAGPAPSEAAGDKTSPLAIPSPLSPVTVAVVAAKSGEKGKDEALSKV